LDCQLIARVIIPEADSSADRELKVSWAAFNDMSKWPEAEKTLRKNLNGSYEMAYHYGHHDKHQSGLHSVLFLTASQLAHHRLFATFSGGDQLDDQSRSPLQLHDVFVGQATLNFEKPYDMPNNRLEPVEIRHPAEDVLATYAAWFLLQEFGGSLTLPSSTELQKRPADPTKTDMTRVTTEAFRFLRGNVEVQLYPRNFHAADIGLALWDQVLLGLGDSTSAAPVERNRPLRPNSLSIVRWDVSPTFSQKCRSGKACFATVARSDFVHSTSQPVAVCSNRVGPSQPLYVSDVYGVHMLQEPHTKALTMSAIRARLVTELFQACPKANFWPLDIATHHPGLITFLPTKHQYLRQIDNLKPAIVKPALSRALHRIKTQLAR
jgi:hypothetical protein